MTSLNTKTIAVDLIKFLLFFTFLMKKKNDNLEKQNPIFSKYIQNPYNINVWNIIKEANQKYQENNNKYLVYSCPFMCGGKNSILLFFLIIIITKYYFF